MDNTRWHKIEDCFDKAVGLDCEARGAYLAEACADDSWLREEVESLLESYEGDSTFLQRPVFERGLKVLAGETAVTGAGDNFGCYKILSTLGSGGMGSVYLAMDARLGRKVAIKILSSTLVEDENRVKRFRQEARAASKISHPNVAAIYEIGSFAENHFIAMEFVDGITLRERLARDPLTLKEAVNIGIQVGLAIEAAHAAGIVHRDIKPENIMVRPDGYIKVLDFGLAKLTEAYHHASADYLLQPSASTGAIPTEPGLVLGTIAYMSPEQARGLAVDPRTDIWSWGVVLYETIAGGPPFKGDTTSDLLADILRVEPALLGASLPSLPQLLKDILRQSLAKEKEARYGTMTEALVAMRRLQKVLEVQDDPGEPGFEMSEQPDLGRRGPKPADATKANAQGITDFPAAVGMFKQSAPAIRRTLSSLSKQVLQISRPARVSALAVLFGVAILVGTVFMVERLGHKPSTWKPPQFTRLSSEANVIEAAISPDGKYVASVVDEGDAHSLWIRQTNTSANLQILAPTKAQFSALSFSPDGDNLYYEEENKTGHGILYLVSVLGGTPRKLSEEVDTPVTFSPDGSRMAFVRQGLNGSSALITAKPDGADEKTLAKLERPLSFWSDWQYATGPAWSPDGETIACPSFDETDSGHANVMGVRIRDGVLRTINAQKGFLARIRKLIWLSDSSGLLMTAKDQSISPYQLWFLSAHDGATRNITNDAEEYVGLSATKDSRTILTTKVNTISSLWVIDAASRSRQIPSSNHDGGNGISWTRDGRILYARNVANASDVWAMNSDGSARKQLTFDGQRNVEPTLSPDGRYVVFVSYREGIPHVWRIGADGKDLKQLTTGSYEDMPTVSRDSKWIIYDRTEPAGLWKISIDGGKPVPLTKEASYFPDVSPDGKLVAYLARDEGHGGRWKVKIISFEGGPPINEFLIQPGFNASAPGIRWTHDGLKVTYAMSTKGVSNIWGQAVSGGSPQQLTRFGEGQIRYFSWSIDGQLACVRASSNKDLFLVREFR